MLTEGGGCNLANKSERLLHIQELGVQSDPIVSAMIWCPRAERGQSATAIIGVPLFAALRTEPWRYRRHRDRGMPRTGLARATRVPSVCEKGLDDSSNSRGFEQRSREAHDLSGRSLAPFSPAREVLGGVIEHRGCDTARYDHPLSAVLDEPRSFGFPRLLGR